MYMDSAVYFNGKPIGTHAYGYTGFNLDLTPLAHTDGHTPNVLDVKVRNQVPSSRWYSGSGIYRDVHLVVTDPVHVTRHGHLRHHAEPGQHDQVRLRDRARGHDGGQRVRRQPGPAGGHGSGRRRQAGDQRDQCRQAG
ncbi:hypothetical protein GCM10018954_088990 [Kutzneria kofuensis]